MLIPGWIKYGSDSVVGKNQKIKHIGENLLSTIMIIAHLILREMDFRAETITTIGTKS